MRRALGLAFAQTFILASGVSNGVFAAETGAIAGHVAGGLDKTSLAGAVVEIRENGFRTTTRDDGAYSFSNITPGTYTLVITPRGGQPTESGVSVAAGKTTQQDVVVGAADPASAAETGATAGHGAGSALEEIVVLA